MVAAVAANVAAACKDPKAQREHYAKAASLLETLPEEERRFYAQHCASRRRRAPSIVVDPRKIILRY